MSQPFAFALVLGWGSAAGVVALGACSALADLLVEAVLVLAGGTPALDRVRQGEGLRAWVAAMVLGMAPVVACCWRPGSSRPAASRPRGRWSTWPPWPATPMLGRRPSVRGVQTVDWSRCGHLGPPFCAFWAAFAVSREVEH